MIDYFHIYFLYKKLASILYTLPPIPYCKYYIYLFVFSDYNQFISAVNMVCGDWMDPEFAGNFVANRKAMGNKGLFQCIDIDPPYKSNHAPTITCLYTQIHIAYIFVVGL